MSIESKIPAEELNVKDLALERAETERPVVERLRKLADKDFFQIVDRHNKVAVEMEFDKGIEKAAWLKLAFPDHQQDLQLDDQVIIKNVKDRRAQRRQGFNITSYLYLLAHLKILFPNRPEFWSPKPKEIPLFKREIRRQAKRMETDHSEIILFGHSGATYKILRPQDSQFIQEIFSKPEVQGPIHEQLEAVIFPKQFTKPGWWSTISQVSPYTMVNPEDAKSLLSKTKPYYSDLEKWLGEEKIQHPEYLSEAMVTFSDGLEVTDNDVRLKFPTTFKTGQQSQVPTVKKF